MKISLSEIDKARFGVVTAKAMLAPHDSPDDVAAWCEENNTQLLIARLPGDAISLAQDLESAGFFLTDILVYYKKRHMQHAPVIFPQGYGWRMATPDDAVVVGELAKQSFRNYVGHYHADRRLSRSDCDLVYSSWASNSCLNNGIVDDVFLALFDEQIVGFLTIKKQDGTTAEIILNGVHPQFQNHGLYQCLIRLANNWAWEHQLQELTVSTQLSNLAVQRVWCRQGFEPHNNFYTFHKWFSR